jgi:hypothetical protein
MSAGWGQVAADRGVRETGYALGVSKLSARQRANLSVEGFGLPKTARSEKARRESGELPNT